MSGEDTIKWPSYEHPFLVAKEHLFKLMQAKSPGQLKELLGKRLRVQDGKTRLYDDMLAKMLPHVERNTVAFGQTAEGSVLQNKFRVLNQFIVHTGIHLELVPCKHLHFLLTQYTLRNRIGKWLQRQFSDSRADRKQVAQLVAAMSECVMQLQQLIEASRYRVPKLKYER